MEGCELEDARSDTCPAGGRAGGQTCSRNRLDFGPWATGRKSRCRLPCLPTSAWVPIVWSDTNQKDVATQAKNIHRLVASGPGPAGPTQGTPGRGRLVVSGPGPGPGYCWTVTVMSSGPGPAGPTQPDGAPGRLPVHFISPPPPPPHPIPDSPPDPYFSRKSVLRPVPYVESARVLQTA